MQNGRYIETILVVLLRHAYVVRENQVVVVS